MEPAGEPPKRQVRALYSDDEVTVYQAYRPEIALAAVAAGRFVPPFQLDRMTWIKPSFLWTMYRSAWATRPGQEHVLAVRLPRSAFDGALAASCLSGYDRGVHGSHDAWRARLRETSVRVQWDPEKTITLAPLPWRSIQIGLGGDAAREYSTAWVRGITDVTGTARAVHAAVRAGDLETASALCPVERPYPLPAAAADAVGATA
jgi:hypothetical protein